MKKYLYYIFLFLPLFGYNQTWLSCGQGFVYPPKALFSDTISNKLYASGFVTTVDGVQANSIASWDGVNWDTLGHGALGTFSEFLIRYKDKLYLQKNDNIYAWDFNSQSWDTITGGFVNGYIWDAVVDSNNDLILVGEFNRIGGVLSHNIMRFDGTTFYPVGSSSFGIYFRSVAIFNNEIYVGGNFGNDTIYNGIAKWNGSQWLTLDSGFVGGQPEVADLIVYNNRLYAGGSFFGTKKEYNPSLAVWDGIKWNNIGGIFDQNNPWGVVYKLHKWNNKLLVCGSFNRAGDIIVNNLALWNDTNWCSINTDPQGLVWVSTIFQNKLYIGEHETLNGDSVHLLGYLTGGYNIGTCGGTIGIDELINSFNIKLYPNPTTSSINIIDENNQFQNAYIEIKNYLGQVVFTSPFASQIDLSSLSSGMYFLTIENKNDKKTIKIIKE